MVDHDEFVECLHGLRRARVVFTSQREDGALRERICAPMDFGPDRRSADKRDRYHLFDPDAGHTLKKFPEEMVTFEPLAQVFDRGEFITWDVRQHPSWLERDWGVYS